MKSQINVSEAYYEMVRAQTSHWDSWTKADNVDNLMLEDYDALCEELTSLTTQLEQQDVHSETCY